MNHLANGVAKATTSSAIGVGRSSTCDEVTAEVQTHLRLLSRAFCITVVTTARQPPLVRHVVIDTHPVVRRGQRAAGDATALPLAAAVEAAGPPVDSSVVHQVGQVEWVEQVGRLGVVTGQRGGEGAWLVSLGDLKVEAVVVSEDL